ncbi:MAG: YihY/virulence factor BrkB family protein [Thermaceae bacterium]|nr:YihY/virulence factor BrkB family protein [Thermaceae bacterium]
MTPWRKRLSWLAQAFGEREVSLRAAALAYYAFFSIFPLLLLTAAGLGYLVRLRAPFAVELEATVLEYATQTLATSGVGGTVGGLFSTLATSAPVIGLAGVLGLLWGISGSLSAVSLAMGQVFDPEAPLLDWKARLRAGGVILAIGGVFVLFTLGSQVLGVIARFVPVLATLEAPLRAVVNFLLPIPAFVLLYQLLPNRRPGWGAAVWGAVIGGVLFGGVQVGFGVYLRLVSFQTVFGPLASLAVLLIWLQFSSLAFLIGALFAAAMNPKNRAVAMGSRA